MANELKVSQSLEYAKGRALLTAKIYNEFDVDVAATLKLSNVQAIGTSEEAIELAGVSPAGAVMWFHNLDATNFIEIRLGTGAGNDMIKLLPGESWPIRAGSDVTAPYAIADTAACDLEYAIFGP